MEYVKLFNAKFCFRKQVCIFRNFSWTSVASDFVHFILLLFIYFLFFFVRTKNSAAFLFFQVMFRLNFLTVILCLVMNQPYQFYYYVPLVSFWYTVFHITMVLPPRLSKPSHASSEHSPINYFYCIIKFVALGGVITIFFLSEVSW